MNAVAEASTAAVAAAPREPKIYSPQLWFGVTTLIIVAGWLVPLRDYLTPRSGIGYWLGIVGGSLMVLLLLYPARKRIPGFTAIGSVRSWFQIHVVLGVIGPVCILYHCGYRLGATNSNVALWSMLVVAGSGVVGRYLYARIHHGLYGHKATLAELRADADRLRSEAVGAGRLLPQLGPRVDRAERLIAISIPLLPKALSALLFWQFGRWYLRRYITRALLGAAVGSMTIEEHRSAFGSAANRYSDLRLTAARRVAEFESCERLFSLWHVLHLPMFGMLLVAGIVHVIAVNVY